PWTSTAQWTSSGRCLRVCVRLCTHRTARRRGRRRSMESFETSKAARSQFAEMPTRTNLKRISITGGTSSSATPRTVYPNPTAATCGFVAASPRIQINDGIVSMSIQAIGHDAAMRLFLIHESSARKCIGVRSVGDSRRRIRPTESNEASQECDRRKRQKQDSRPREHTNQAAVNRQRERLEDGSPERDVAQRGPAHEGTHHRRETAEHTGIPEVVAERRRGRTGYDLAENGEREPEHRSGPKAGDRQAQRDSASHCKIAIEHIASSSCELANAAQPPPRTPSCPRCTPPDRAGIARRAAA